MFEGNSNFRILVGSVLKLDVFRIYIVVMLVVFLKCSIGKNFSIKLYVLLDIITEIVVIDIDILLVGVDDDEND